METDNTETTSEEEPDTANAEATVVEEEHEKDEESGKEADETLAYYFKCAWADSGWDTSNEDRIGMGIIQITIPDDKKREERINQMLVEESMKRLPGKQEQEWWDMVKLHIDYRSDRYLCWHYIPRSSFSEDYEWENLYFTLDLEKERLLEYPGEVPIGESWTFRNYWGELDMEMEENWEKQWKSRMRSKMKRDIHYKRLGASVTERSFRWWKCQGWRMKRYRRKSMSICRKD